MKTLQVDDIDCLLYLVSHNFRIKCTRYVYKYILKNLLDLILRLYFVIHPLHFVSCELRCSHSLSLSLLYKWRRIKNYDPFYSPHHSRFLFCFLLCVRLWMWMWTLLLFRRIPEIQSRQFHLLLSYLSMTAQLLFVQIFIQLWFAKMKKKWTKFFGHFLSERKKGYYQKLYILPEIIHTPYNLLNLNWIYSVCIPVWSVNNF